MRKLGLVLVLLFTLSIVSAADFTLSGKITPKDGVSSIGDGSYDTEFRFSNGFTWNAAEKQSPVKITMTNGVFTADLSDIPNVASVVAASETVTMEVSVFGASQTFSNIPLTTVPKAVYAETAGTATTTGNLFMSTPTLGDSETNNNPQLEIKLNNNNDGRFWNFRSGGFAIPTVFSSYGDKQLELNRALSTFYGSLNVAGKTTTGTLEAGTTIFSGRIYQDQGTTEDNYDVWIQGSKTVTASDDNDRNLALLGSANTDKLYLNWGGQYEKGVVIGSATSPTSVMGALNVGGVITGDGRGITGLVGGNSITKVADTSTGAKVTGNLDVTGTITGDGSGITGLVISGNSITKVADTSTGAKVTGDLDVTGTMFGSWTLIESITEDNEISGTATSDGFLVVRFGGSGCENSGDSRADITVDSKIMGRLVGYDGSTVPVAKGNTWKVDHKSDNNAGTCTASAYWLPIGASTASTSHGKA